jgi:anti-sigma28 factor (negative regulator of flagellin synthesis)
MRIDDLNRTPDTQGAEKTGQGAHGRPVNQESITGSDKAEVSQLAQSLAPPDNARIEQLRLQVQSGSYDVSAHIVAGALIEAHLKE